MKFEISNPNAFPELKLIAADRIWNTWWRPHGHLFQVVTDFFDELPEAQSIPFCLVAQDNGNYVGSVLGLVSDLEDRPELSPWVAALWVDPKYRRRGVAEALVRAALDELFALGYEAAYLCATAEKRGMYQRQGWVLIEADVGDGKLDVFEFVKAQHHLPVIPTQAGRWIHI